MFADKPWETRNLSWCACLPASSPLPSQALLMTPFFTQRLSWMSCRRAPRSGSCSCGTSTGARAARHKLLQEAMLQALLLLRDLLRLLRLLCQLVL